MYVDRTGCAWRYLPADFPPGRTVYGYFAAWRDDGALARLHDVLRAQVRVAAGRDAEPTAAVIDSQIVARRQAHAFEVLPRCWVVERTFAWISKHRRTTRDYVRLAASHEAMILWAMIALMTRRLAQPAHLSDAH